MNSFNYHISMKEVIPSDFEFKHSNRKKSLLFEFKTNFILKTREGVSEIIDSKTFDAGVVEGETSLAHLDIQAGDILAGYKLNDYSIPGNEIQALFEDAIKFADLYANDPQYASLQVIPILVSIDLCSAQQEGERLIGRKPRLGMKLGTGFGGLCTKVAMINRV